MRFIIQWVYSEKRRQSVIPTAFWYFSLGGSLLLLIYSLLRRDHSVYPWAIDRFSHLWPQSLFYP